MRELVRVNVGLLLAVAVLAGCSYPEFTPVERYLETQGRFKHLDADQVASIQAGADQAGEELTARAERSRR